MGGATRSHQVAALVLYEPSLGLTYPDGSVAAIEGAVDAGDPGAAADIVLREVLEVTPDELDELHGSNVWSEIVANGHTIAREAHAEEVWISQPNQFASIRA
jgi:hypothetical protein